MRHRMNFKNILLSLIVILALPISFAANAEGNLEVSYDEQQNHQSQLQQKNEMDCDGGNARRERRTYRTTIDS